MDYEFLRDERGHHSARLSMGHEALGAWLTEELGTDLMLGETILAELAALRAGERETLVRAGGQFRLSVADDEVEVAAHVVAFEFDDELEPDMAYYDEEQLAGCGLADFESLLRAWLQFVAVA